MRGLVEQYPHPLRRLALGAWRLAKKQARHLANWSTGPVPHRRRPSAKRQAPSAGAQRPLDPITPEVHDLVCVAFPRPHASETLNQRVAEIWSAPSTAPRGSRLIPPIRGWTRNGLFPFNPGCGAKLRWGSLGALATVLVALWLALPRGDVLAAAIRALRAAPVVHLTMTGGNTGEMWVMPEVGMYIQTRVQGREVIMVDDRTRKYQYDVDLRKVDIWPSDLVRLDGYRKYLMGATGAGLLQVVEASAGLTRTETRTVTENGKKLHRLGLSHREGWRMELTIDPETDRLVRIEEDNPNGRGGVREQSTLRFDYPDPATVDRSRFRFEAPPGVLVLDHTDKSGTRVRDGGEGRCWDGIGKVQEALRRYVHDHGGRWPEKLRPALAGYGGRAFWRCPLDAEPGPDGTSYAYHRPTGAVAAKILKNLDASKAGEDRLRRAGPGVTVGVHTPHPEVTTTLILEHRHEGRPILELTGGGTRTHDSVGNVRITQATDSLRENALVSAIARAMTTAPVLHITVEGKDHHEEAWQMPGVGIAGYLEQPDRKSILVDDLKRQYSYDVQARRVEIRESRFQVVGEWDRVWRSWTGRGIVEMLWQHGAQAATADEIDKDGQRLARLLYSTRSTKHTFTIDPKTDRILLLETEEELPGQPPRRLTHRYEYPDPATVDRGRFQFRIPAGVAVINRTSTAGLPRAEEIDPRCWEHLERVQIALRRYLHDHDGRWPAALQPALEPYGGKELLRCPLDRALGSAGTSYLYRRPSDRRIVEMGEQFAARNWVYGDPEAESRVPRAERSTLRLLLQHRHEGRPVLQSYASGHRVQAAR